LVEYELIELEVEPELAVDWLLIEDSDSSELELLLEESVLCELLSELELLLEFDNVLEEELPEDSELEDEFELESLLELCEEELSLCEELSVLELEDVPLIELDALLSLELLALDWLLEVQLLNSSELLLELEDAHTITIVPDTVDGCRYNMSPRIMSASGKAKIVFLPVVNSTFPSALYLCEPNCSIAIL
jgi:hypothetical protein